MSVLELLTSAGPQSRGPCNNDNSGQAEPRKILHLPILPTPLAMRLNGVNRSTMVASFISPFLFNLLSLICLVSAAYYAIRFHRKPVLAWTIPLHLSYQDYSVAHSKGLAEYDPDLWNRAVNLGGAVVAAMTLVAFQRQRHYQSSWTYLRQMRGSLDKDSEGKLVSGAVGAGTRSKFSIGMVSLIGLSLAALIGSEVSFALLGMHATTWTVGSPIRQVSTAAITSELYVGMSLVPTTTPWDIGSVMLRSAFEHMVWRKGGAALDINNRYLARYLRAERVQIGTTVYPTIRTHGVGAAPVPWGRSGYKVAPQHRILSYDPIVAATNVTVTCSDKTEDWVWDYQRIAPPVKIPSIGEEAIVHRFTVEPKIDWNTRGSKNEVMYLDDNKTNLRTWMAMWKRDADPDTPFQVRQIFLFTSFPEIYGEPDVSVIECVYGGADVVRQVYMSSATEPIVLGEVLGVKDALTWYELYPAATAIDKALSRDGGMMVAGMATDAGMSFEMFETYRHIYGGTVAIPRFLETVLTDTAQAYFSLVRQWKEESQFFSWRSEFPQGRLETTTRRLGGENGSGLVHLTVLGLLAVLPLMSLVQLSRSALFDYRAMRRRQFSDKYELKDGVIKKKSD